MSDVSPAAQAETCWQCDAPADPSCAHVRTLVASASRRLDGLGYSVKRGLRTDAVRVSIPRCRSCQDRNILHGVIVFCGVLAGLAAGASLLPAKGFGMGLGGVAGAWVAAITIARYERRRHRRALAAYPALARLRAAGWKEPD